MLAHVNEARGAQPSSRRASLAAALILLGELPGRAPPEELEERVDLALGRPSRRLAAYGSLRPGHSNHREIAELGGRWSPGSVRGRLAAASSASGAYPTLAPDARGEPCAVELLESIALPGAWPRLDAFEGAAYRRELALVELAEGQTCIANLYAPSRPSG